MTDLPMKKYILFARRKRNVRNSNWVHKLMTFYNKINEQNTKI